MNILTGNRLLYLGMTIIKTQNGYKISMKTYIKDTLKVYGKLVKDKITPAGLNLFKVNNDMLSVTEREHFHSITAKLFYIGKRGRLDILLAVQYLCTRVKAPNEEDIKKLEYVLGYLQLTKNWTKVFDSSPFEHVEAYIDTSFGTHMCNLYLFLGSDPVWSTRGSKQPVTYLVK